MPTDEHTSTSEDFCNGKEDNAHSNSSSSHRNNNHKIKQHQEEELIEWMNSLNLSKPVKNFGRDCSDAGWFLRDWFEITFLYEFCCFSCYCRNHCALFASLCGHTEFICACPFIGIEEIQLAKFGQVN
jgi:hypothetical protein